MLDLDAIYERTQADPPCVSTGATILETRDLVDALRQETKWVASLTQEYVAARAEAAALRTTLIEKDARIVGIIDANGDSWRKAKDEAAALRAERDEYRDALINVNENVNEMGYMGYGDLMESTWRAIDKAIGA